MSAVGKATACSPSGQVGVEPDQVAPRQAAQAKLTDAGGVYDKAADGQGQHRYLSSRVAALAAGFADGAGAELQAWLDCCQQRGFAHTR